MNTIMKKKISVFLLITFSALMTMFGIYFFRFPNNFSFGGVPGLAVVLQRYLPFSASSVNLVISMVLLLIGCLFLGKGFGLMTGYCSILVSVGLSIMEKLFPLSGPITDQPMLELCFAVAMPGLASALLFNIGASSGGTDIVAMLLRKYTNIDNIGTAIFLADALIVFASFFAFDAQTGLYSVLGLLVKSLVIDNVIESINLCKYFNIICDDPEPITDYIIHTLKRSATVCDGLGAFTHNKKYIIFTVLKRPQAVALRYYVKQVEPTAFVLITNTSEIIGRGFHN